MDNNEETHLPPGFRFHPTDEELVTYYLTKKVLDRNFTGRAITEVDLNKCEPWELPEKANMGEKEWYFFNLRDRKYPTGLRTNRATGCGYWKATGKDREIHSSRTSGLVGMKKTLVFYKGRAPKGEKSNWVMHEYRLDGKLSYHYLCRSSKDEWVISRVFQKIGGGGGGGGKKDRWIQHPSASCTTLLPPLLDYTAAAASEMEHVSCFSTITAAVDTLHANFNHHHLFSLGSSLSSSSSSSSAMVSSIINASVEDTSAAAADQFGMNFPSNLRLLQNNEMGGGVCSTSAGEYWLEESEHHHQMVEKTQTSVGPTELDYVWTGLDLT